MAGHSIPHFHNDPGVPTIKVRVKEFMCTGAKPPFDHPHIFIDMGSDNEAICSYCSTRFVYDAALPGFARQRNASGNRPPDALSMRAIIAGAGVGGLTTALALSRAGFDATIYEQAVALEEFGAGLQLTPNATRVLARLGALDAVREVGHDPRLGLRLARIRRRCPDAAFADGRRAPLGRPLSGAAPRGPAAGAWRGSPSGTTGCA